MKNLSKLLPQLKKPILILTSLVVFVILISVIITLTLAETPPKNLGDKLEYVGSRSRGCGIGCARPSYFFGTDINLTDIEEYFPGSKIERKELISTSAKPMYTSIIFSSESGRFNIDYYEARPSEVADRWKLDDVKMRASRHPYTVEVSKNSYKTIEALLSNQTK